MLVVSKRLPRSEGYRAVPAINAKPAHDYVVVAREPSDRRAIGQNRTPQYSVRGVQNIVPDLIAGWIRLALGGRRDIDAPSGARSHDYRVVVDLVATRPFRAVDRVERDAAGVVVVQQIVSKGAVADSVAVDARAAARAVLIDSVLFHNRKGDDAVARRLGPVAIHVDSCTVVVV